jgi:predicted ester cyclase
MGAIETGNAFVAALNAQQWDAVANYLTDDFTSTGNTPQPLGKQEFIGFQKIWFAGMPDYHVASENVRADGNAVHSTTRVTGAQTKPLVFPGLPPIPATGKRVTVTIPTTVTMRGDKIAAITFGAVSSPSVFEQLGVQPPA